MSDFEKDAERRRVMAEDAKRRRDRAIIRFLASAPPAVREKAKFENRAIKLLADFAKANKGADPFTNLIVRAEQEWDELERAALLTDSLLTEVDRLRELCGRADNEMRGVTGDTTDPIWHPPAADCSVCDERRAALLTELREAAI